MGKGYLEVQLQTINDKVKFSAQSRSNPELIIDYFPPFGNGEGYTSLELLLISFSSCISTTLLTLLRAKRGKTVSSIKVNTKGILREEHPKALSHIQLELTIASEDLHESDIEQALAVSQEKLCPVWAMIKGNVEINVKYSITR